MTIYLDSVSTTVDETTKLTTFVDLLLRLLVDNDILDVHTAGSLSVTFCKYLLKVIRILSKARKQS